MPELTSARGSALPALIIALLMGVLTVVLVTRDDPSLREEIQADAYKRCTDQVRDQLRAPATASFPAWESAEIEPSEADALSVAGYVDSENGFGANVRSDWLCAAFLDLEDQRVTEALVLLVE